MPLIPYRSLFLLLDLSDQPISTNMFSKLALKTKNFRSKNSNSDSPQGSVQAQHIQNIPNSNPSRDLHSVPTLPFQDIPRNILAFRTITHLLSKIQQGQAFSI